MAYKLRYSDYSGTDTGPPDPERWVGPPGPAGPPGPPGPMPPGAPFLPLSGGTVVGNLGLTGSLLIGQATWTPASTPLQPILDCRSNLAGVVSGASEMQRFIVSSDTLDARLGDNGCFSDLGIYHNVGDAGGAHVNGGRQTIWTQLNVAALTTPALQMNGIQSTIFVTGNTNGAFCQPLASSVAVYSGGSVGSTGSELFVTAYAGSSVANKYILQLIYGGSDAVAGSGADAMLLFASANAVGAPGAGTMIGLGNAGQGWPVSTAGAIMAATPQIVNQGFGRNIHFIAPQCAFGIDFANVNFTGSAFRAPGFSVDATGGVHIANAVLAPSASGVTLDIPNQIVTAASVATGGGGGGSGTNDYYVGDILFGGNGGQYRVATVTAGGVATVTVLVPGAAVTPPTNPVATTGGSGINCTLTLTWSAATRNGLSLNPTGQHIGFNGTVPVAKPTVSGAKAGNAALASLLSALAAYGLVTDSST